MKLQKDFAGADTDTLPIGKFNNVRFTHIPLPWKTENTCALVQKARQSSLGADLWENRTCAFLPRHAQVENTPWLSANPLPEPIPKDWCTSAQVKTVLLGHMGL